MPNEKANTVKAEDNIITQAMLDSAVAEEVAKATATASTEAVKTERERTSKIDSLTIKGQEAIAEKAKAEGMDIGAFLEAQTIAAQAVTEEQMNDLRAAHLAGLREGAGDAPLAVPTKTPETKTEVTELAKTATDEEIKAVFEGSEAIRAEFGTLETFTSSVGLEGFKL